MPIEIMLSNVNIEAGQHVTGLNDDGEPYSDPDAPWSVGFHDTYTNLVVRVAFSPDKLREVVESLLKALDGEKVGPKPKIAIASVVPKSRNGR